ncbi:MAG: ribosome biogenesis GTP-binding protein YihA/YsxC [Desulfovibrio sp.]|jgi:GTP-binding protein|nr:ribosome biogenesis GTP-binding protein YihA/YsxC [Desulfovibrio sp.]
MNKKLPCVKHDEGRSNPAYLILESTAFTCGQLPDCAEAQIALAGRSNVGKSSLINALAGRKNLAKISATPGKTRSINFFRAMPWNFYLVDLPGYGYARASRQERANWAKLLDIYLMKAKNLRALVLLLDCRLSPQKSDIELTNFAGASRLSLLPVLTKTDKCNRRECECRRREWQELLGQSPLLTSSTKRLGIEELWSNLVSLATETGPRDFQGIDGKLQPAFKPLVP